MKKCQTGKRTALQLRRSTAVPSIVKKEKVEENRLAEFGERVVAYVCCGLRRMYFYPVRDPRFDANLGQGCGSC